MYITLHTFYRLLKSYIVPIAKIGKPVETIPKLNPVFIYFCKILLVALCETMSSQSCVLFVSSCILATGIHLCTKLGSPDNRSVPQPRGNRATAHTKISKICVVVRYHNMLPPFCPPPENISFLRPPNNGLVPAACYLACTTANWSRVQASFRICVVVSKNELVSKVTQQNIYNSLLCNNIFL